MIDLLLIFTLLLSKDYNFYSLKWMEVNKSVHITDEITKRIQNYSISCCVHFFPFFQTIFLFHVFSFSGEEKKGKMFRKWGKQMKIRTFFFFEKFTLLFVFLSWCSTLWYFLVLKAALYHVLSWQGRRAKKSVIFFSSLNNSDERRREKDRKWNHKCWTWNELR